VITLQLSFIGDLSGFANVNSVSIENNNFEDCLFLYQLSKMPKLLSLRISHNLLLEKVLYINIYNLYNADTNLFI
jgi:hypothetical protein